MMYLILGLVIALLISVLIIFYQKKKLSKQSVSISELVLVNSNLHDELKRYTDMDKIKSDNRSEANEKINALYDGDPISNAINELRKHKN